MLQASLLDEVLNRHAAERRYLALAATGLSGTNPVVRWLPGSEPAEPRFLVYSVTKTFIAALFLVLQESGELSLDDPLARWLPEVPSADRIALRHLLSHTAGIPDYGGLAAYHDEVRSTPSHAWSFERYAAETFEKGLLFEPGDGWAYSNPGYMLLKRIAELVAGRPFARLLTERIVEPLGLRQTTVAASPADLAGLAPAVSTSLTPHGTSVDVRQHYDPAWVSHGVLASTASDVLRFLSAIFSRRLLAPFSLAEMTRLTKVPVPGSRADPSERPYEWRDPSYGLGLMVDPTAPWGAIYGHNGGGPGYAASAFFAADLGVIVTVLGSEAPGFRPEQVLFEVLDAIAGNAR